MLAAKFWLPENISTHGAPIDRLIFFLHIFMFALFIGWGIYFVYCLVRYRQREGHAADPTEIKAKPSKFVEVGVIIVEVILLCFISIPVWGKYRNERPTPDENPLEVRVVAQQFAWNVHYAGPDGVFGRTLPNLIDGATNPIGLDLDNDPHAEDDVVEVNSLHIPKNRPILVRLSSIDVIHCFALPLLRIKQDVVPGMEIPVWFTATKTSDEVRREQAHVVQLPSDDGQLASLYQRELKLSTPMADIKGPDGALLVPNGGIFTVDSLKAVRDAGIKEINVGPLDPVDIQCAQLCGLNHYRMRGAVKIYEPEAFEEWYAEAGQEEEFFEEDF